jgi:hypothetical protein
VKNDVNKDDRVKNHFRQTQCQNIEKISRDLATDEDGDFEDMLDATVGLAVKGPPLSLDAVSLTLPSSCSH